MFILAHYWGIDEVGVFVLPAILAIVALRWAERRARKKAAGEEGNENSEEQAHVE
ncbi:MAG: hypothetical protein ACRDZM_02935 [Acidimicrobiia bacterium]